LVSDKQVRRLLALAKTEASREVAAAKAGMDPKTARKYLRTGQLPSELSSRAGGPRRSDPFAGVWAEVHELLEVNAGLEAKTLFGYLQRRYPGRPNRPSDLRQAFSVTIFGRDRITEKEKLLPPTRPQPAK